LSRRITDSSRDRTEARDRGLRRVRTATGWITVASTAGAVVLAGGYAQALPGKTASAAPAAVPAHAGASSAPSASSGADTRSSSSSPATTAPAASSAPTLQAPAQAPTTAASTAQTTSGGS